MYTLDTISPNVIAYTTSTEYRNVKLSDTVCNIIVALNKIDRNMFSAQDVTYVINRNVKVERQKVTEDMVKRAIMTEVRHNARGEFRRGMKIIKSLGGGFFQYGN